MKIQTINADVYGEPSVFDVISYDQSDIPNLKSAFDSWVTLKNTANLMHGRSPNIPEFISETCFCLVTNSVRFYKAKKLKSASFDTYNLLGQKTQQIKASSVKDDLTSFGPKSKWDKFYFLDFYNDGNIDGTFNIYHIPNHLIYSSMVSSNRTFQESQELGYRPRIHLKSQIIEPNCIGTFEIDENSDIMESAVVTEKGIRLW